MDQKRKKPFQIDLREWRLWIKSCSSDCPALKEGIYIKARDASGKFYMAVLSLVADRSSKDGCPENTDIADIAEDIEFYAYLYDLDNERHPKNTRNMIDTMLRNSRSINIAPSRTYLVYDKDMTHIRSSSPQGTLIRNDLSNLFHSPPRKHNGPLLLGIGFKRIGIKPSKDTVEVIPLSKDTAAKLQAAYEKQQARQKQLHAKESVAIFNTTRQKYLVSLRNEMEHAVAYHSEGTLELSKIAGMHLRKDRSVERGISITASGQPIRLDELLLRTKDKVTVISGSSGLGKTTALHHLAWKACESSLRNTAHPLPIYLNCHSSFMTQLITSLSKHMNDTLDEYSVRDILKKATCTFFIDGYDDLTSSDRADPAELRELIEISFTSRFVITSRDTIKPCLSRQTIYELLPPNDPVECLMAHGMSLPDAKVTTDILRRMNALVVLSTPMFLWFIVLMFRDDAKAKIPSTPGELMKTVIEKHFIPAMLKKQAVIELGLSEDTTDDILGGLAALGYRMIDEDNISFDRKRIIRTYQSYFKHEKCKDSGGLSRKLYSATTYQGFLKKTADGNYVFIHNMYRDYFASCNIEANWGTLGSDEHLEDLIEWTKWDTPFQLFCGIGQLEHQASCVSAALNWDLMLSCKLFESSRDLGEEDPLHNVLLHEVISAYGSGHSAMAGECLSVIGTTLSTRLLCAAIKDTLECEPTYSHSRAEDLIQTLIGCSSDFRNFHNKRPRSIYIHSILDNHLVNAFEEYIQDLQLPRILTTPLNIGSCNGERVNEDAHEDAIVMMKARAEKWKALIKEEIGVGRRLSELPYYVDKDPDLNESDAHAICRTIDSICAEVQKLGYSDIPEISFSALAGIVTECITSLKPASQDEIILDLVNIIRAALDNGDHDMYHLIYKQLLGTLKRRPKPAKMLIARQVFRSTWVNHSLDLVQMHVNILEHAFKL